MKYDCSKIYIGKAVLMYLFFVVCLLNPSIFKRMKKTVGLVIIMATIISCNSTTKPGEPAKTGLPVVGTWELFSATLVEKGDTVTTEFAASGQKMIKIINPTHFAFLRHDLTKGKDSAFYSSGGGSYTLKGDQYTEQLDYCSDRGWEGHSFPFTVTVNNDTLIQTGIEKIDSLGINRLNIEKYIRVKN